jgi:hypothetical protein
MASANNLGYIQKHTGALVLDSVSTITAPSSNAVGVAGTAAGLAAGVGGYNSTATAGAGGAISATAGAGGATTSTGTGGAGGAATVAAGAGGASVAGTGGAGGAVYVRGGAGAASNGAGGSVILAPGAGNGTGSSGGIVRRGTGAIVTGTGNTMTGKELLAGFMEITVGTGVVGIPVAGTMNALFPSATIGDLFYLDFLNNSGNAAVLTPADGTVVAKGGNTVANGKAGRFTFLKQAAGTWWCWSSIST